MSTLGHVVRVLRTASNLTQRQLAEQADLSAAYLSQIETGVKQPSMATVRRLAAALGTSADKLLALVDLDQAELAATTLRHPTGAAARPPVSARRSGRADVPVPAARATAHYRKARSHAEATLHDPAACRYLAAHARELANGPKGDRLGDVAPDMFVLTDLLRAYADGAYRTVSWEGLVLIAAGLRYFVSPDDVVPDFLDEGYLDDAAVLAFVIEMAAPDIDEFSAWQNSTTQPRP